MSKLFSLLSKFYGSKSAWLEVEEELGKESEIADFDDFYDPFKNLIIGILSQNTNDTNSTKAYIGLVKEFKRITPKILAKASLKRIRDSIKSGGLYNLKADRIKTLSQVILEKYKGDFTKITRLTKEKAKIELLSLYGIGPKTADVFIGYCMKEDTLPIDTNIKRVAKRIGIVDENNKYNEIQTKLCEILAPKHRLRGHELLIRLGRDFCKVRSPLCEDCPVRLICKRKLWT